MPRRPSENKGRCLCDQDASNACHGALHSLTAPFVAKRPREIVELWQLRAGGFLCDKHYKTVSRAVKRTVSRLAEDVEDLDGDAIASNSGNVPTTTSDTEATGTFVTPTPAASNWIDETRARLRALAQFLRKSPLITDPSALKAELNKEPLLRDFFETFETSTPQRTVAMLYHLAYSQSSHANVFQKELACALDRFGVTDRALEMLHATGVTVSVDTLRRFQHERMENHSAWVDRAIRDNAGTMINLYIDDYSAIHGIIKQRRTLKADQKLFATVCVKPVPSVAAIAINEEVRFTGQLSLAPFKERLQSIFVHTSSTSTLQRLLTTFIVEEQIVTVEERLQTHTYEVSPKRAMEGVIVLDVKQMPLKSHDNYLDVLRATVAATPALMTYLKDHVVLMPADNPGQKYGTYLVHNAKEADRCWLQRIIPMLGPLHLALNGIEDAYQLYLPVWTPFWQAVDGRDLPESPHIHRMHYVLEIALVGWREIREVIIMKCRTVVDAEIDTLVWLLEDVLPTFLNVYANVQRSNKLAVYEEFVLRSWVIFLAWRRRNYVRLPLAFLAHLAEWRDPAHPLHAVFLSLEAGLAGADEYAVEHVHSWIRRATTDWSPAESVRQAGCLLSQDRASSAFAAIYGSKEARRNKVSDLAALSIRAGQYWVELFGKMLRRYQAGQVATIIRHAKTNVRTGYRWLTHNIDAKGTLHPPAYAFTQKREISRDEPCVVCDSPSWAGVKRFTCRHSAHAACATYCPICLEWVTEQAREKISAYNAYLNASQEEVAAEDGDDDVQVEEEEGDDSGAGGSASTSATEASTVRGAYERLHAAALELPDVVPIEHSLMSVKRRRT